MVQGGVLPSWMLCHLRSTNMVLRSRSKFGVAILKDSIVRSSAPACGQQRCREPFLEGRAAPR